jgi:DNA-binding response OmpR family regulator
MHIRHIRHILVASGHAEKRAKLRTAIEREGYEVTETDTADQVIGEVGYRQHHVLVLDSSIPGMEPCELCRMLRTKSHAGIIVLTHHDKGQARIDLLNAGADDCISAHFIPAELLARVRALLRRVLPSATTTQQILLHDRAIDLKSHEISGPGGRITHLTPKEFFVLQYLVANGNKPLSHEKLS